MKRQDGHFVIVASKYNSLFVDSMLNASRAVLASAGVKSVKIIRVPGAFEIPVAAARLARSRNPRYSAIICLGVILRGATTHAQHIGEAVSEALMRIQVETEVPVVHEVLLLESKQQAVERCLAPKYNRGKEAAHTALEMAEILAQIPRGE